MSGRAKLMFPDTKDSEGLIAELARHQSRPLLVTLDLSRPIASVSRRHRAITPRAAVPKAPIHKNCYTDLLEYEIWGARKPRIVHRPVADAVAHERGAKFPFCGSVALRPDGAHPPTAFRLTENVHPNGFARPRS